MRAMTFNLRFENDRDGPDGWSFRRDMVVEIVTRYEPDLLATQEGKCTQLRFLEEQLPAYRMHAPGRVEDDTCQYPSLFFLHRKFHALEGGEFWLSKTPEIHRSKDWDSAFPRMMHHLRLRASDEETELWVVATHLDHIGGQARYNQAKIIRDWLKAREGPKIVMGDFNDSPDSRVHDVLTQADSGLSDTWEKLGRKEDKDSLTHHGFKGIPAKTRMDWILASSEIDVKDARIIKDQFNGRYPSDHFPYMADLEI
ncbi:MAG: endonuclease/exonuclease/phosphatase family protein [Planctomycetota bacterium]|jgi:endonuclease/exonuclease/phosphatase family metal-dependent hydrolase